MTYLTSYLNFVKESTYNFKYYEHANHPTTTTFKCISLLQNFLIIQLLLLCVGWWCDSKSSLIITIKIWHYSITVLVMWKKWSELNTWAHVEIIILILKRYRTTRNLNHHTIENNSYFSFKIMKNMNSFLYY